MGLAGKALAIRAEGVASMLAKEIVAKTQPPRRDRGGAEEKEESVHRGAQTSSADGGGHGHK